MPNSELENRLEAWYLEAERHKSFPGDAYFGLGSLLTSDIWYLEVPEYLRKPLVATCRSMLAKWLDLPEEELTSAWAGRSARIYRHGSICPMHVDTLENDGRERVACLYHVEARGEKALWQCAVPYGR